ncbi:MAG TPA: hypothetical protein VL129_03520 [Pseudomonas sp.]|uniref:hypothetical protein n=1 Tax=Pseudomonas sp. TaxID=306 RepID=UPI002C674585|nr:hypothetical protein [Pseudomonas sp.]HTO18203.1 hypothetical protein [Pseudomonas sp.]
MTTPADTVPKTIIKIFPETIGSFARNPAELPAPSAAPNAFTQLWKWLWLPLLVACVPAFLFGQLAAGIACLALGVILLVLALLPAKRQVEPRAELDAFFDEDGLHLPAEVVTLGDSFIPYAEMTRILTLDLPAQAGKTVVWWRQYQIHTRRPLEKPHVEINTLRSLDSVVSVLNRLKRLPTTRHIDIPPPVEAAPPAGAKSKEIRLR